MKLNPYLLKSTVVAALGGLLFGFDTAVIAGTTHALTETFHLSAGALGMTVSIALWGTIIGSLLAGIPGDKLGRRDSLRIMAVLYLVSALGCALAGNWYVLVLFRFVGGLGIGGSSVLGPMYIAEVAPAKWRGRLVGLFQFNIVFGILLAYLSNYIVGTMQFGAAEWRWKLGVPAVPALFFLVMLFGIPRSPRWLVKKQRIAEARDVLRMTGEQDYEQELQEIILSIDAEHITDDSLFTWKYRFPIFLAVSIGMFNQLSGINAILYYLKRYFRLCRLQQSVFRLASSRHRRDEPGVYDGGDVCHRSHRPQDTTAGRFAGVAAVFFTRSHQNLLVWLLIGYIAFFAFSQGAVIWVFISEVFPNRVRARGQSLGSFSHWFMNALISGIFPLLAASSGGYSFVFFSVMMGLQFFFECALPVLHQVQAAAKTRIRYSAPSGISGIGSDYKRIPSPNVLA